MALDTAAKRRSVVNVSTLTTPPAPGGGVTVGDRAQQCWCYRGLAFADAVVVAVVGFCAGYLLRRRHRWHRGH